MRYFYYDNIFNVLYAIYEDSQPNLGVRNKEGYDLIFEDGCMSNLSLPTPTQLIVDAITEAVLAQRLIPGTKLNEADLVEIFGVGRTTVRQALIRLSQDKLVTIEHNRGAYITKMTDLEIRETFEVLAMIECAALEKLGRSITAFDIARLRRHIDDQKQAHQHGNADLEFRLAPDFHVLVVRMAHNRVLDEVHGKLTAQERLITSQYYGSFDQQHLCSDHAEIVSLIEGGQVEQAQALLVEHYRVLEDYCLRGKAHKSTIPLKEALKPDAKAV